MGELDGRLQPVDIYRKISFRVVKFRRIAAMVADRPKEFGQKG